MQQPGYRSKRKQLHKIRKPYSLQPNFDPKYLDKPDTTHVSKYRPYEILFEKSVGGTRAYGYRLQVEDMSNWLEPLHSQEFQTKYQPYWPVRAVFPTHRQRHYLGASPANKVLCDDGIVYTKWEVVRFILIYNLWLPSAFKYTDEDIANHLQDLFYLHPQKEKAFASGTIRHYRRVFNSLNPTTPCFKYVRYPWNLDRPKLSIVPESLRVYIARNSRAIVPLERIYPTRGTGVSYLLDKIPPQFRWHRKEKTSIPVPVSYKPPPQEHPDTLRGAIKELEDESISKISKEEGPSTGSEPETSPGTTANTPKVRKTNPPYVGFNTFPGWKSNI